jgi:hypothetical protein
MICGGLRVCGGWAGLSLFLRNNSVSCARGDKAPLRAGTHLGANVGNDDTLGHDRRYRAPWGQIAPSPSGHLGDRSLPPLVRLLFLYLFSRARHVLGDRSPLGRSTGLMSTPSPRWGQVVPSPSTVSGLSSRSIVFPAISERRPVAFLHHVF